MLHTQNSIKVKALTVMNKKPFVKPTTILFEGKGT